MTRYALILHSKNRRPYRYVGLEGRKILKEVEVDGLTVVEVGKILFSSYAPFSVLRRRFKDIGKLKVQE